MDLARKLHPMNCIAHFVDHSLKTVMEEAALHRQWHANGKILVPLASKHAADMAVLSPRCQVTGSEGHFYHHAVFASYTCTFAAVFFVCLKSDCLLFQFSSSVFCCACLSGRTSVALE